MRERIFHRRFVTRQFAPTDKQVLIFVLCVALSIVTIIALNAFRSSVNKALLDDARSLHGGDIIIHSHYALSEPLADAVAALVERGTIESAKVHELYSVVRTLGEDGSLLASLKVVEPGYPFYGNVGLKSGRAFADVLEPGAVIVEQSLLDRLGIREGDTLHIGSATLSIKDVVTHEPDRPVNLYALGPRVFMHAKDLDAIDLIKKGSRIQHNTLLRVHDPGSIERIAGELRALAAENQERVDTFRTAESRVKKFFDNFLFFLSLIGFFTLLLAGIGIQSALGAFLREKEATIAIMKTVGATSRFITVQYLIVLCALGLFGTLAGLALGSLLALYLPMLFRGLIPSGIEPAFSLRTVGDGLILGTIVVGLFAFVPLYRLRLLRPNAIFRKEDLLPRKGLAYYLTALGVFLVFLGMVLWQLNDLRTGLWFMLGVAAFLACASVMTQMVYSSLKRARVRSLASRQALRGLFRPRNATRSITIILTASLSVIFSIYLIEQNIDATFIKSYPPDLPNVFFLDIQPGQLEEFSEALGMEAEYYPVVRGRVTGINGAPIDAEAERKKRGDNMAREFNLTYRDHLLDDETLIKGDALFRSDWDGMQVSVLDTVVEIHPMDVGDIIAFKIQGIPMQARVSSIRSRTGELIQPFFYFVFEEKVLKDAPQTIFTAIRVEREKIAPLQNRIVARFPNVSVIDVTQTVSMLAGVMQKLSGITRFFTLFSMIAGVLIIISSVFATRYARLQEAVYFKILGARTGFILKVFTLENIFLGLVSALLALFFAQTGSWIISSRLLDVPYKPFPGPSCIMILVTVLLVTAVGLLSSISILRRKPVTFLREHSEE